MTRQDGVASIIIDASMALAWVVPRQDARERRLADLCLACLDDSEALVPELWHLELANSLHRGERAGVLSPQVVDHFNSRLDSLPIITDTTSIAPRRADILSLARRHALSAYDVVYLDLALRLGATLATFDRRLADACRAAGGRVFGDTEGAVHEAESVYVAAPEHRV